jgi:hypothetical protein
MFKRMIDRLFQRQAGETEAESARAEAMGARKEMANAKAVCTRLRKLVSALHEANTRQASEIQHLRGAVSSLRGDLYVERQNRPREAALVELTESMASRVPVMLQNYGDMWRLLVEAIHGIDRGEVVRIYGSSDQTLRASNPRGKSPFANESWFDRQISTVDELVDAISEIEVEGIRISWEKMISPVVLDWNAARHQPAEAATH